MRHSGTRLRIKRGQIYRVNLPGDPWIYQERPVLVLQNDIGNRFCPTVIVAPLIADTRAKNLFFSVLLPQDRVQGLEQDLVVLLFQLFTMPRERFSRKNFVASVPAFLMNRVDEGLKLSLGLSALQEIQTRFNRVQES